MSFVNASTGYISITGLQILKTTNGGVNLTTLNYGISMDLYSLSFVNDMTGWGSGSSGRVIKTTNGGLNWSLLVENISFYLWDICFVNDQTGWIASGSINPGIIKTTNGGNNWVFQLSLPSGYNDVRSICFIDNNKGWASGVRGIYVTSNGGLNWININPGSIDEYYDVYFINQFTGWTVSLGGKKIFKSTNGGFNWSQLAIFNETPLCVYAIGNDTVFVGFGNYGRILRSINGGNNWTSQTNYSSSSFIHNLYFYNSLTGYACGNNGLILKTTNGGITGFHKLDENIPDGFLLYQNYPNPFNPATKIRFAIPVETRLIASLRIYDILGREVATLVNEQLKPGTYEVEWDATNYPSGVYYYRLSMGDASTPLSMTETRKMVLLK